MKLTRKQIEIIQEHTPRELWGKHLPFTCDFGWHMKMGANWSYQVGYVAHNGNQILAVKVFGQIVGGAV